MLNFVKSIAKILLNIYPPLICKLEFKRQIYNRINERPVEFNFVFRKLGEIYPRKVLDVGTGTTALPNLISNCGFLVTATDNIRNFWKSGMQNRHFHVIDDDITNTRIKNTFDLITCISVLEHIEDADSAVKNMFSLLKTDGHLLLTFPYNEKNYVKNVYDLPGSTYGQNAPYITQSYSRTELNRWLEVNNGVIVEQEYWQFWDGNYWTVGKEVLPPRRVLVDDKHQITCIHIKKSNKK